MAVSMRTRSGAASPILATACVALWLLAAVPTFVAPGGSKVTPEGRDGTSYVQLRGATFAREDATAPTPQNSWAPRAAALAAVLGLVAGLAPVASPVRAEEAAAPAAAPVAELTPLERARKELQTDAALRAAAPSKEERVKRALEQVSKVEVGPEFALQPGTAEGGGAIGEGKSFKRSARKPVKKEAKKSDDGFSFKLPSFSAPDSSPAPKKKVFISPADELDEDELSLARPNPPLFWALFLGPSFIYLGFWVAGSLNIL